MSGLLDELKAKLVEALELPDVTPEEIGDDEPLFDDGLGLDSIDVLELAVMIEKEYGLKIDNQEVGQEVFVTIRTMADYIEKNRP